MLWYHWAWAAFLDVLSIVAVPVSIAVAANQIGSAIVFAASYSKLGFTPVNMVPASSKPLDLGRREMELDLDEMMDHPCPKGWDKIEAGTDQVW